ncbi:MAG: NAD(P)-binding protein [Bermanella sp.]
MNKYDVIIFGAGLSGLVAAYTLSSYGIKCCILEKSDHIGGGNASFKNDLGDIFDTGYHALDESRSKITSSLFKKVMPEYIQHTLRRGIALDGSVFKYNADIEDWPVNLKNKLSLKDFDNVGDVITSDNLANVYGVDYSEYCKNTILYSYPSEVRSLKEGGSKSRMFDMVYPWFFPKLEKTSDGNSESTKFHNKMRNQEQTVIYPKHSGFFGFIEGLYESIDKQYCDIFLGCKDINIKLNDAYQCESVEALGVSYTSSHYFWCAPFIGLASLYGMDLPKGVPQKLALGSFRFNYELPDSFHEILVGDPNHKINRISFPGLLRNERNNLLQVEFIFPADEFDYDVDTWRKSWVSSLIELGIIENGEYVDFNFKVEFKGMITSDPLDRITKKYEDEFNDLKGNIYIPFVNAGPENINRLVPSVIDKTISFILSKGI